MPTFDLSHLFAAAYRLQNIWAANGISFCFIGGLAVQRWGELRLTQDVDATVATGFGNERTVIELLRHDLHDRIANATEFAMTHRVYLGQDDQGVAVDVALAGLPYETNLIERSCFQEFLPDEAIRICVASDLVILKAFANRPRDWQDIRGVLIRSRHELDWPLIEQELGALVELKEEPEILAILQRLRSELDSH